MPNNKRKRQAAAGYCRRRWWCVNCGAPIADYQRFVDAESGERLEFGECSGCAATAEAKATEAPHAE